MIELSNLTAQELQPGQSVTFNKTIFQSRNGCECFNQQIPTSVKLCGKGTWRLTFSGNVTSATAGDTLQLAIAISGTPLVETTMNSVPSAANALNNVSTETLFKVCCCDLDRVSVQNTGSVPVTLGPNSAFIIERRS